MTLIQNTKPTSDTNAVTGHAIADPNGVGMLELVTNNSAASDTEIWTTFYRTRISAPSEKMVVKM